MKKAKTKLVGILNVTPDSFFEGSRKHDPTQAIELGIKLVDEGADVIDVGGESTRPNATPVTQEEEIARVIPVIKQLSKEVSVPISIDTMKMRVAEEALKAGATIINDVTGFVDPRMVDLALSWDVEMWVMHMLGNPQNMQNNPAYDQKITEFLINWFVDKTEFLLKKGIKKERIILDPGIGFGKTVADNLEIIQNLARFRSLGFPVLLGLSRKSFMSKILNKPAKDLLAATIAMNTYAIPHVDYIRVHDVKEHRDVIDLLAQL